MLSNPRHKSGEISDVTEKLVSKNYSMYAASRRSSEKALVHTWTKLRRRGPPTADTQTC